MNMKTIKTTAVVATMLAAMAFTCPVDAQDIKTEASETVENAQTAVDAALMTLYQNKK